MEQLLSRNKILKSTLQKNKNQYKYDPEKFWITFTIKTKTIH